MNISNLTINIEGLDSRDLVVTFFECRDGVGQIPRMTAELTVDNSTTSYSPEDFSSLRGRAVTLFAKDVEQNIRNYAGIIQKINIQLGRGGKVYAVQLSLTGWPRTKNSYQKAFRFFQEKTAVQIAEEIFQDELNIVQTAMLGANPSSLAYQVQYGESDGDFLARILLREQLLFRVETSAEGRAVNFKGKLIIFRSLADFPVDPRAINFSPTQNVVSGLRNGIFDLTLHYERAPDVMAAASYSTTQPNVDLRATTPFQEKGEGRWIEVVAHSYHSDPVGARERVVHELKSRRAPRYRFSSDLLWISPGITYSISGIEASQETPNRLSIVSGTQVFRRQERVGNWSLEGQFEALSPSDAYMPQCPPAPVLPGLLHGVVVAGKNGAMEPAYARFANDDTVDTDEFGRIRVRILWHAEARAEDPTPTDAPWLRLMTPWAGQRAGFIALPRAGQEVVVSFINGNADQPVILGCLFGESPSNPSSQPWSMQTDSKWVGMGTRSKDGVHQFLRLDATSPNDSNAGVEMHSASRMRIEAAKNAEITSPDISIGSLTPTLNTGSALFNARFPSGPVSGEKLNQIYQDDKKNGYPPEHGKSAKNGAHGTSRGTKADSFKTKEVRIQSDNLRVENTTQTTETATDGWKRETWTKATFEGKFEAGGIRKTVVGMNVQTFGLTQTNATVNNLNFGAHIVNAGFASNISATSMVIAMTSIKNKPFDVALKGFDFSKKVVEEKAAAVKSETNATSVKTEAAKAETKLVEAKQGVTEVGSKALKTSANGFEVKL